MSTHLVVQPNLPNLRLFPKANQSMRIRRWADVAAPAGSRVQLYVKVAARCRASRVCQPLMFHQHLEDAVPPLQHMPAAQVIDDEPVAHVCLDTKSWTAALPHLNDLGVQLAPPPAASQASGVLQVHGSSPSLQSQPAASHAAWFAAMGLPVSCSSPTQWGASSKLVGTKSAASLHGVNAQVGLKPHVMGHVPTNQPTGAHSGCPQLVVNMSWEQTPPVCIAKPATQVAMVPWLSTAILASSSRQPAMAVGGRPSPGMEPKPHAVTASAAHNTALNGGGDIWVWRRCVLAKRREAGG